MEHFDLLSALNDYFVVNPTMATIATLVFLLFLATAANFFVKRILIRIAHKLLRFTRYGNDAEIMRHDAFARLANAVPAMVVIIGISHVPNMPDTLSLIISNLAGAFIILTIAIALGHVLDIINTLYIRHPGSASKPIKGYIQVLKIAISVVCTILIIATLIDKSPLILLSGLGAMAAVLMLVFQDTLLSLVASIQISSSDMVRVGDWIEMPNLNADGDVIDIALHTVKVQNWDKTITTLPTRRLVTDPFKNWRGMQESGGRRIKRAIQLDQASIHFLTEDERHHLKTLSLLSDYLQGKERELTDWNTRLGECGRNPANTRRLTNIGTFRAYIRNYLQTHPLIRQDMTLLVRQLSPAADGLPLEVYCFTATTLWAEYETIQSDLFDHLYAILPEFGLRAFQQPSGADLAGLGSQIKINA